MRFTILQTYIFRVFLPSFILSAIVFSFMVIMVNLVQFVDKGILSGFSFHFFLKATLYLLPNIFSLILPLAFLMASLLVLAELSASGEIMAMRASGYSFNEILLPLFLFSLVLSLLLFYTNNWLAPHYTRRSNDYIRAMAKKITKIHLQPRTFQKIIDWCIYSAEVDNKKKTLKKVKLSRVFQNKAGNKWFLRINAKTANYRILEDRGIEINLKNGKFNRINFKEKNNLIYGNFNLYTTFMPFFTEKMLKRKIYRFEMNTPSLLERIKKDKLDESIKLKYKIELLSRNTLFLTPLIFFVIASPLGLLLEKGGKATSFSLSLLIIFLYYGLFTLTKVAAKKYELFFPWIMFIPPISGFVAGTYIWKKKLYLK